MRYDQYYDERASDSKNIPLEYRTRLAGQLGVEMDDWQACLLNEKKHYEARRRERHEQARRSEQVAAEQQRYADYIVCGHEVLVQQGNGTCS